MEFDIGLLVVLSLVVLLASTVHGVTGLGFSLIALAALATVLQPRLAVVLMSVTSVLLQPFQLAYHWEYRGVTPRIMPVVIAGGLGAAIGSSLFAVVPAYVVAIGLGAVCLLFVVTSLRGRPMRVSPTAERGIGPIVGGIAGVSTGAVGAAGPIVGSYLLAIGLSGRAFVFAITATFAVMSVVRLATLALLGEYTAEIALVAVSLAIPGWLGQRMGFWLQGKLSSRGFERVILIALTVASANLIYRGVAQGIEALS